MSQYVIRRNDGAFVAEQGSKSSYTFNLLKARIFSTLEAAQRDCCGNENVVLLADLLRSS
jgi:hypothetical protein